MATAPSTEPTPQRLAAIRDQLKLLADYLDPAALAGRVAELEEEMGAPGFWDDQETAAKVSAEHARTSRKLDAFAALEADVETSTPASSPRRIPTIAAELEEQLRSVEQRLAALEEERLFSGRYDAGDALVTVNAGAGGTDAQDWAEMVLRMQMRWAERRGFEVELLEASAGEEAGIKSATFRAPARTPTGCSPPRRACTGSCACRPFDSANRRQTSFAGVEVAPVIEDAGEVEIDADDLQVDTYRASGAGGQHVNKTDSAVRITHRPSGIVVQCQNERSQTQNRETAMKMLRSKLVELRGAQAPGGDRARRRARRRTSNFGSQIRSYVLHPYTMVKDHRTNHEMGDAQRVLDGDLDGFVRAELLRRGADDRAADARRTSTRSSPTASAAPGASTSPATRAGRAPTPALRFALGDRALAVDIPQDIQGIDLGPSPTPYERAERLAAEAYGAATHVVPDQRRHAGQPRAVPRARAARRAGRRAAQLPRLARRRARALRRRAGLRRARVRRRARHGPRRHAGRAGRARWSRPPDARAAFIVSPTYYGMVADVAGCAEVAHAAGVPLVVDQAWGPHFGFHPDLPPSRRSRWAPTRC